MAQKAIFIVGGHLSPAIAVIDSLSRHANFSIYYVGRIHALERDESLSLEYKTIQKLKIKFLPLTTGRVQRELGLSFFVSLLKIPIGFLESIIYLLKFRPSVVIAFGGYVAFPVCISAWILGIPYCIHEQTSVMGLSNRSLAKFAKRVFLSFDKTKKIPKGIKTNYIGLPVRNFSEKLADKTILEFGDHKKPLIVVSGGSLGSRSINNIILSTLPKLLLSYRILHQTGSAQENADYNSLISLKKKLPENESKNYRIVTDLDYDTFFFALKNADVVVGRSSANTSNDLKRLNKRSILIPLPWSGSGEQLENARSLEKLGIATVIEQKDLTSEKLITEINRIQKVNSKINSSSSNLVNPADTLVSSVLDIIQN